MTEPKRMKTIMIGVDESGAVDDKNGQWIFDPDHKIDLAVDIFDRDVLQGKVLEIRNDLDPIIKGEIQKGRNASQYSIGPEYRKTTLKDAREIVKYAQQKLNLLADNIFPRIRRGFKKQK